MLNDQGSHDVLQLHQPVRRRPANKGRRYPADPPRVEETIGVMREAGEDPTVVECGRSCRPLACRPAHLRGPRLGGIRPRARPGLSPCSTR
jgi:hypothetical protein